MNELTSVPKFNIGYRFQFEPAQDSYVLLYPEGMVKFNGPAAEILKRIDGEKTVNDIIAALEQEFVGADVKEDVLEFLTEARHQSWIKYD